MSFDLKGSISPTHHKSAEPPLIFATSSGRIGIVAELNDPKQSDPLNMLALNLDHVIQGPDITRQEYRKLHAEGNARSQEAQGIIDGD